MRVLASVVIPAAACVFFFSVIPVQGQQTTPRESRPFRASAVLSQQPLTFERNDGQTDAPARFLARGPGYTLFLTDTGAALSFSAGSKRESSVRMAFVGASRGGEMRGVEVLPGRSNYLPGRDPKGWFTNLPTYRKVVKKEVYKGVDVVYYGNPRELEFDFVVAPGANPRSIRVQFQGAGMPRLTADGDLTMDVDGSEMRQRAPIAYQEIDGVRQSVRAAYILDARGVVRFAIGDYDVKRPLVIDPVLIYRNGHIARDFSLLAFAVSENGEAYVGGTTFSNGGFVTKYNAEGSPVYSTSGLPEVRGLTVDGTGRAYIAGVGQNGCCSVAVVAALDETGSALLFSTTLEATESPGSVGWHIALAPSGDIVVAGGTGPGFPVTPGAAQTVHGGSNFDAFVAKLNSTATELIYATYVGGSFDEGDITGVAVDAAGNAYVSGLTFSDDFPTTPGAFQRTCPLRDNGGCSIVFVTKINSTGTAFAYSTFLGGGGTPIGAVNGVSSHPGGLAVDSSGHAYVSGYALTTEFPTTPGSVKPTTTSRDAFVTKLSADGSSLVYSTYLGGDRGLAGRFDGAFEEGKGIAVDSAGNAYVTGAVASLDFPLADPIQQVHAGGLRDGYVAKLDPTGSTLLFSTYYGDERDDQGLAIGVDAAGSIYFVGTTYVARISDCPIDVTERLHLAHLGFWPIGLTPFRLQLVIVRNDSPNPIGGPLAFVMDNLQNGIFLGPLTTRCSPEGVSRYQLFEVGNDLLEPGAATAFLVPFFKTGAAAITYTPRVLRGVPPR